ncbi:MAG: RNA-processing protein [Candidatus Bathyarchaeota archaeon]|nr:MAG: RNA-processing protein [Candidatus Bathyarchaeota archaeon]
MDKQSRYLKIPLERIGVLIGSHGKVKRSIEDRCGVELEIDSDNGSIGIALRSDTTDPLNIFEAEKIILAIGRGFSPDRAFELLEEDVFLEILDLRDYLGKSSSTIQRIKSRIIGERGKTRRIIEETTGAKMSIYGHTVAIIGATEEFQAAKEAVIMIIRGRRHRTVYRFLHRKRQEIKKMQMALWKDSSLTLK